MRFQSLKRAKGVIDAGNIAFVLRQKMGSCFPAMLSEIEAGT
jgi:hypothetical protein